MQMDIPFEEASRAILANPERWLPSVATAAQDKERQLLAEVGFEVAHVRLGRQVEIEILNLERSPSKVVLLIRWKAHRAAGLFPVLEGSLEVSRSGPGSQLAVTGEYQPPGGAVGLASDRAVLHRIAKATVKDFVQRTATVLPTLRREGTTESEDFNDSD